jgi:F-type H+-transporting ATPase subunit epsilon
MLLEIITPEKKLFSGQATSVTVPGSNGMFQVLNNHAPIISTLKKGVIKADTSEGLKSFEINGGVIEVLNNKVTVLAD